VWFQKISIPPPPHGRSMEIPRGRGVLRQKFPRGVGGLQKPPFPGGEEASKRQHTIDPKHEVILTYVAL